MFKEDSLLDFFSLLFLQNLFHKDAGDSPYHSEVTIYSRAQMTFKDNSLLQQSPHSLNER